MEDCPNDNRRMQFRSPDHSYQFQDYLVLGNSTQLERIELNNIRILERSDEERSTYSSSTIDRHSYVASSDKRTPSQLFFTILLPATTCIILTVAPVACSLLNPVHICGGSVHPAARTVILPEISRPDSMYNQSIVPLPDGPLLILLVLDDSWNRHLGTIQDGPSGKPAGWFTGFISAGSNS